MEFRHRTYSTVIDWIEFEIQISERCKFWTVRDALRDIQHLPQDVIPYVKLRGDPDNYASDAFGFRIQDPKSFAQVQSVLDGLDERFNFVAPVKVTAIEVAFDTRIHGATVQELAKVVFDRYRFSTHAPADSWYFYRRGGNGRRYIDALGAQREGHGLFADGWQLTDTNSQDVPLRAHGYVKTTDNGGKTVLNPAQYAARFEHTLRDESCPCKTLPELEHFDFASLAPMFKFRRLRDDLHPAARYLLDFWCGARSQVGRPGKYRRKHPTIVGWHGGGEHTKHRGCTVSDTHLNKVVRDQLRNLTTAWKKKPYADSDAEKVNSN